MNKIKYPSLNGLRAISIILVIVHHLVRQNMLHDFTEYKWLKPLIFFIQDGHLGVNIFFVISGFLISSLLVEEERVTKTISIKNFYLRRTLRIFPAYYFLLLIYFVAQLLGIIHLSENSWLTAITYTKYFNWRLDWFTAHIWSLSIEEQFYLFWPIVFMLGDGVRKKTAFFLILIVPCIRFYLCFHPISWINDLTLFTRIDAIATGCLIALYKNELLELLRSHFRWTFLFSLTALFFLRYIPTMATKLHLHLGLILVPLGSTHRTIANILIGVILLYSVFGAKGIWFDMLNSKILNYIGLLSYSIYLWQQIFISELKYWVTTFPQNLIFIFMLALFSYYCIEKPFLKLRDKFQKNK